MGLGVLVLNDPVTHRKDDMSDTHTAICAAFDH